MTDMGKRLFALIDEYHRNAFQPTDRKLTAFLLANGVVVREKGENLKADIPSLFECSKCGWFDWDTYTTDTGVYNFCPNCGADMRGAVNDG